MEAQAQMKYHHSERCFTYRMKRPMVFVESAGFTPSRFGIIGGRPLPREVVVRACSGENRCHLSGWPRGDPTVLKTAQIGLFRQFKSLVSRHLPDGEFGWGGISVTRQRRCPKASSVGTEISRRTQA